jgi:hypothetical protein
MFVPDAGAAAFASVYQIPMPEKGVFLYAQAFSAL